MTEIVRPNGSPVRQDQQIQAPDHVAEQYAKEQSELMENEINDCIEWLRENKPHTISDDHEVHARPPDKVFARIRKKVIFDNFPNMKWQLSTVPLVLFKNIDDMSVETEVIRNYLDSQ